ncbi:MAG: alpha/beta hydrolase [Candidatus Hydrogenedentes bacterium]|nr:alpha/beta hydrolase [Candidatus Hydrogenedentota bacterium]
MWSTPVSIPENEVLTIRAGSGALQEIWQEWRAREKTFPYRGNTIAYHDEGRGEVLVCIHGFPSSSWDWHRVWPALTSRFRVIAADMIGFGYSAKPRDYTYSLLDQANLHEALLRTLEVDRIHVLAHDYGDSVAQELLARHHEGRLPFAIKSVCLLNGGIIPGKHRPRMMQRLLISPLGPIIGPMLRYGGFCRSFSAIFGPGTKPTEEELELYWREIQHREGALVVHKLIRYMAERRTHYQRWVGVLRKNEVPLSLVFGEADPVSGLHMLEAFRAENPEATAVCLKGIGHYPQVEAPGDVLRHFLAMHAGLRTY